MLRVITPLFALLSGVVFLLLGAGLLSTLLAVRAELEGFSAGWLGLITSGYFGGYLIGTLLAPKLIRRVGHIRSFAFCAALISCLALAHALFINTWAWLAFRIAGGVVLVTLYTIVESWLNAQAPAEARGSVFATYMVANLGALAVGQQLLRVASPEGAVLFSVVSICVCLAVLPVTWTRLAQPAVPKTPHMSPRRLLKLAPLAGIGALGSGLAMGAFWGLAPLFASRAGLDQTGVANFMTAAIIGGAALQFPLGRWSDRSDRRRALVLFCALAAALAGVLAIAGWLGEGLTLAVFLFGGLAFAIYPVCAAHLIDHVSSDEVLAGTGTLLLLSGLGSALGPVLAGGLMTHFGLTALPLYFLLILGLAALISWHLIRRQSATEPQPAAFVPMLRTGPAALAMMADTLESPEDDSLPPQHGSWYDK